VLLDFCKLDGLVELQTSDFTFVKSLELISLFAKDIIPDE